MFIMKALVIFLSEVSPKNQVRVKSKSFTCKMGTPVFFMGPGKTVFHRSPSNSGLR